VSAKRELTTSDDVLVAKQIGIGSCQRPECGCKSVYVQLIDEREAIFAVGPLAPEDALALAHQLRAEALKLLGGEQ
jgi:hypothetical protein